jgi:hypothetical protein
MVGPALADMRIATVLLSDCSEEPSSGTSLLDLGNGCYQRLNGRNTLAR